jgi:hypothetical protein
MTPLTDVDREALTLAVEVTRKESWASRKQIDDFLSSRPWFDVAAFCASCAQSRSLHLPPWVPAPCDIRDGAMAAALNGMMPDEPRCGYRAGALLRRRMSAAGVSRWHPSPLSACETAEATAK